MAMTQAQRDANNYASLLGMPLPYDANGNPAGGQQPASPSQPIAQAAAQNQAAPANSSMPNLGQANTSTPTQGIAGYGSSDPYDTGQTTTGVDNGLGTSSGSTGDQFFNGSADQTGFDPSMLPSNQTGYNAGSSGGSGQMQIYNPAASSGGGGGIGQMTGQNGQSAFGNIGASGGGGTYGTQITPRNSGINTSGAASAYIADTNAAYAAAQKANQQMYNTVNSEYNQDKSNLSGGYAQMLGLTQNLGASETAQNQQLTQQQTSDATQRAISQGLGNTSVLSGMQQGAQNQGQIRQLGINNQVANQQLGVLNTSISGMQQNAINQQNFQERVSNPYPNTSGYMQAIQMGGSGAGGFYGQSTPKVY